MDVVTHFVIGVESTEEHYVKSLFVGVVEDLIDRGMNEGGVVDGTTLDD